jgi:hypothetical protein
MKRTEVPAEYRPQVHGQLIVTGLPFVEFVQLLPGLPRRRRPRHPERVHGQAPGLPGQVPGPVPRGRGAAGRPSGRPPGGQRRCVPALVELPHLRLLDLFCGAGGCAVGYHRAGFTDIVGVDLKPQPNYPFTFVQGDALEYLAARGAEFDAIHASPPCQRYTVGRKIHDSGDRHPDLVAPCRSTSGSDRQAVGDRERGRRPAGVARHALRPDVRSAGSPAPAVRVERDAGAPRRTGRTRGATSRTPATATAPGRRGSSASRATTSFARPGRRQWASTG